GDGGTGRGIATPGAGVATRVTLRDAGAPNVDRTAARLPEEAALFWIAWSEHDDGERSARAEAHRDALVTSGSVRCNDLDIGDAPEGQLVACVPFPTRAVARFVPSPRARCEAGAP